MNVRFEGNNGHDADVTRCLLMTQSGHRRPITKSGLARKGEPELRRRIYPAMMDATSAPIK